MKRSQIDPREVEQIDAATLRRALAFLRPHLGRVAVVLLALTGAALLALVPSVLLKRVVDEAIPRRDVAALLWLCAGMIAAPLAAGLCELVQKYGATVVGERVMFDLRSALHARLQEQSLAYFARTKPGEAVSRVLNDVQGAGQAVSGTLVDVAKNVLVLGTTFALAVALDWRLALVAAASLPAFVLPAKRVGRRRKQLKREAQARSAELTSLLVETLSVSGALLVQVFGAERREQERFRTKAGELVELSLRQSLVGRWFQLVLTGFEAVGPALVFGVGGYLAMTNRIGLGTVVAFATLLKRLYSPASALTGVRVDLIVAYAYFERVFAVLDLQPAIADPVRPVRLGQVEGRVTFQGVGFSYGEERAALHGVDLDVAPGKVVALVGPSGAGKSTLVSLVPRLYDPTEGAVLLDGHDLRTLSLGEVRGAMAVVTQETFLFHTTVLENVRYGRPEATLPEVVEAARAARIHHVIESLPAGYDTVVGERGHRFSGGERQRLAIARALLRNPRVLILDEATSALDAENEALVQEALEELMRGRTTLVVAHRLSTVRRADEIVVLDEGRIVERGPHEALVRRDGLYAALHRRQHSAAA